MELRKVATTAAGLMLGGALLAGCGDTASDDGTVDENTMVPGMEETMAPTP